jgi:hypothetical protein
VTPFFPVPFVLPLCIAFVLPAEFGISDRYVRQRMKLATLTDIVKVAYRQGEIDTATAEAIASDAA